MGENINAKCPENNETAQQKQRNQAGSPPSEPNLASCASTCSDGLTEWTLIGLADSPSPRKKKLFVPTARQDYCWIKNDSVVCPPPSLPSFSLFVCFMGARSLILSLLLSVCLGRNKRSLHREGLKYRTSLVTHIKHHQHLGNLYPVIADARRAVYRSNLRQQGDRN